MAKIEINEQLFNELQKGAKATGLSISEYATCALGDWNETSGHFAESSALFRRMFQHFLTSEATVL